MQKMLVCWWHIPVYNMQRLEVFTTWVTRSTYMEHFMYDIGRHKKYRKRQKRITSRDGIFRRREKKMNKGIQQEKFKIWDLKWFCFDKKGWKTLNCEIKCKLPDEQFRNIYVVCIYIVFSVHWITQHWTYWHIFYFVFIYGKQCQRFTLRVYVAYVIMLLTFMFR